jgi:hypothetical protein
MYRFTPTPATLTKLVNRIKIMISQNYDCLLNYSNTLRENTKILIISINFSHSLVAIPMKRVGKRIQTPISPGGEGGFHHVLEFAKFRLIPLNKRVQRLSDF